MNLDFTRQLLAGFSPREISLRDNFQCPCQILMVFGLNWLDAANFIALGEATLAKEAQSLVGDDLAGLVVILWTQRLHFLLDDL